MNKIPIISFSCRKNNKVKDTLSIVVLNLEVKQIVERVGHDKCVDREEDLIKAE